MRSKSKARSKKDRASQKQRSEFLAAPVHKAPPGRQKSEREFCLFGGVLFVRRAAPFARAGRFFEACRCLAYWLLCLVFRRFFCRCSAALFPACGLSAVFCLACAACLPFGRRRLCFRLAGSLPLLCKLLRPLPCLPAVRFVCAFSSCFGCLFARSVLCARLFSLIFRLFLPNFFLSNLFSFVAQAATGPSSLVPSRGFVPGLRVLLSAAFSRAFAPIACLPVLRCLCGFSLFCFSPFPA